MSLVPCYFDSEYTEDELTVWILSQHFIAETVVQQPLFLSFLYDTNHVFFNVNNPLKLFVLILFQKYV